MYPSYSSRFETSLWSSSTGPSSSQSGVGTPSSHCSATPVDYYQQQQPSTSTAYYHAVNPPVRLSAPYYGTQQCYGNTTGSFSSQAQCCPTNPSPSSGNPSYNMASYAQYAARYFHHQQQQHQSYAAAAAAAHLSPQNLAQAPNIPSSFHQDSMSWRYSQTDYLSPSAGQVPPGHPGYGPHPVDPNAAYYYGHQMDPSQMHRPQAPHGWPPQNYQTGPGVPSGPPGYPPGMRAAGPMRPPPPQSMVQGPSMEEQQRYEEQRHLYFQQQQAAYAAQQQQLQQQQQHQQQQHQQQQQQQQTQLQPQAPQPQPLPVPTSSLQIESVQNRAPSAGPTQGGATPDSSSRLSAEDAASHRPPSHSQAPNPTSSLGPCQTPQPSSQIPISYYGQTQAPQMFSSAGLRPGGPPSSAMSMKPAGYPPGYGQPQTSAYPSVMSYPESYQSGHPGLSQQQHAMYQQQIWNSQQAQRFAGPHVNIPTSSAPQTSLPIAGAIPRGPMPSSEMNAAQQAFAARRPSYFHMQQGPGSQLTGSPSPSAATNARLRYNAPSSSSPRPAPQSLYGIHSNVSPQVPSRSIPVGAPIGYSHSAPSTSAGIGGIHTSVCNLQPNPVAGLGGHGPVPGTGYHLPPNILHYPSSQPMQFPPGSVEATIVNQRRRRKLLAKDLTRADPRRLTMALRSSLEAEITWALNALNVLLYDDSAAPIRLREYPALLNVLVEHFRAQLALLFPSVFKVNGESKVRTVDDEIMSWFPYDENDKTSIKHVWVAQRSSKTEPRNFTMISRTGRDVATVKRKVPELLKRLRPDGWVVDIYDETLSSDYFQNRVPCGLSGGTSAYLFIKFSTDLERKKKLKKAKFGLIDFKKTSFTEDDKSENSKVSNLDDRSFWKKYDDDENVMELKTLRPTALCKREESQLLIVRRCLSISNILRGLSFLQDLNDEPMCRHSGLLYILGRLLRLCADERRILKPQALVKKESLKDDLPAVGELSEATKRLLAPGDLLEPDESDALLLQETANQLREDAFVIFTHLSGKIDLYDFDSDVSWPIFDGLIHWCVSKCAEAKDPLAPGCISPRNYCLETICKMSVIEHNVDLLVSTGSWQRMERFIKNIANLIAMNEEVPYREFAIVILHAICAASEAACIVTALETPAISHLVAFLEWGDASFHQVAQQNGMIALRENPELVGTSVGMLRKAAVIMLHMSRVPICRKYFFKHQQLLLQFTMSQLMDSKVGATIADVLYEMQRGDIDEWREREERKQEKTRMREALITGKLKEHVQAEEEKIKKEVVSAVSDMKNKVERDENAKAGVEVLVKPVQPIKELSPPPAKRQRLENGTLNYVNRNGNEKKPLVNGDVTSQPIKAVVNSMSPRKNATVVENGTGTAAAGSVQAVA